MTKHGTLAIAAPVVAHLFGAIWMSQLANDLSSYWMPFTSNRAFKADPRMLVAADGVHYTTQDGRRILDGAAGLWCVNAGHARREIADAIAAQAMALDYAPNFQMGHPLAFEVASRVARLAPEGMSSVFLTNSGSESVDTALKMALAYWRAKGEGQRTHFIGRERGYHGVGFGGMSVGGIGNNRKQFAALLPAVSHLPHTHDLAHNAFSRGQPAHGAAFANELERLLALHGDRVAAVIIEPVAGSTGVLVPPVGYLERIAELCRKAGVLLIFDEVITGFGRLGASFAARRFGVTPDMITMAKGLTNGTIPMGAVAVRQEVHDTVVNGAAAGIEFFHGYTYSGHPLACAAALASLDIHENQALNQRSRDLESAFEDALHGLARLPGVIDVRNIGLMGAVELKPSASGIGARGMKVFHRCFDTGALVRVTGDIIALSPPLTITEDEIRQVADVLAAAISAEAA